MQKLRRLLHLRVRPPKKQMQAAPPSASTIAKDATTGAVTVCHLSAQNSKAPLHDLQRLCLLPSYAQQKCQNTSDKSVLLRLQARLRRNCGWVYTAVLVYFQRLRNEQTPGTCPFGRAQHQLRSTAPRVVAETRRGGGEDVAGAGATENQTSLCFNSPVGHGRSMLPFQCSWGVSFSTMVHIRPSSLKTTGKDRRGRG